MKISVAYVKELFRIDQSMDTMAYQICNAAHRNKKWGNMVFQKALQNLSIL